MTETVEPVSPSTPSSPIPTIQIDSLMFKTLSRTDIA
jgi:hypothetical protein